MDAGIYALSHGFLAVVVDGAEDTEIRVPVNKTALCIYTRMALWSCQCWHCRGAAQSLWVAPSK